MSWLAGLFQNPWMLAWLPAAAAPIIIHLWNRRRYREHHWAAMEFLLAAIKRSSRRMRIEQLLLLLLRAAVIALLVLAIARPAVQALGNAFSGGPRTHRVFVIDGSYSMDLRPGEESLFEIAKRKAIEIVRAANKGDGFSLILMSETARPIVSSAAFDREDVIEEIENLRLPHGGAALLPAMRSVESIVTQVRKDNPRLSTSHVYLFSDLGQTTWGDPSLAGQEPQELRDLLDRLTKMGVAEVVPLGQSGVSNLAVTSLRTIEPYATVQQPVTIEATIGNFGGQQTTRQLVELLIDGTRVDQQMVDVPPGEVASPVRFQYQFSGVGDHQVEVRIPGDALKVDNHRYLALPVKEHVQALLVSGKQESTLHIAPALDPDHGRPSESIIRPRIVSESGLLDSDLSQYDCIFLCNVAQFTSREAAVLEAQLQRGAGLVFFLGDQVRPDRYNRELSAAAGASHNVLPVKLEGAVEAPGDKFFYFDPLGYQHPMIEIWKHNERSGLLNTGVAKYIRMSIPKEQDPEGSAETRVALAFDNRDPAIVEGRVGNGRVVVVATAGSQASVMQRDQGIRPWTFLPTSPNFPVIVQRLWQSAVAGRLQQRTVQVFEAIGGNIEDAQREERVTVNLPLDPTVDASGPRSISVAPEPDAGTWSFADTEQSGIYPVKIKGAERDQLFAANIDTQESNLARINPEELLPGFVPSAASADETDAAMTVEAQPAPIHQSILWLVMALVFTETSLAWWLGNRQI